jgi:multidrug efflux pump subunit AcrB
VRGLIAWFAGNRVAANLLMLFFVVAGLVTAMTMKLEVFPETALDLISIEVPYPGASPSEVEEAIVQRVEEAVAGLAGIDRITSQAVENLGRVTIEVVKGWDLQKLLDEVKSAVDRITGFPEEAEKPIVREVTRRTQVISVAVFGEQPEATLKAVAERLKDGLVSLPEVTTADLLGVRPREVHVEISEETLRRHGLTLEQVAQAISRSSLDLPAGSVKGEAGEILVRAKGRKYRAEDYAEVTLISRTDGSRLRLGEIATLRDGFPDTDLFVRFQGEPAAFIQVYRVADQNALDVARAVKEYVEQVRPSLPPGIGIRFFNDRSETLQSRLDLLVRNMSIGLGLVCLILGMFLNARLAFWVALGIPVSFLAGIWALPWFDVSINMISLFSFIMVLGIVVDDAIIIGEHIFTRRERGEAPLSAAVDGTVSIGRPVIFSVLTTIAAFWPLLMAGGMMGKIMRNIPIVVILVLTASLIESLLILPCHLAHSRITPADRTRPRRPSRSARWLKRLIDGPYRRLLLLCLRWRYANAAVGISVLLLCAGVIAGGHLKFVFFPKVEGDFLTANLTMPADTPVERTLEVLDRLEQAAREVISEADAERPGDAPSLLRYTLVTAGLQGGGGHMSDTSTGGHLGQVRIQLLPGEQREISTNALAARWRERVGPIPDAEELTFSGELFRPGNPIELHLSADDEEVLLRAAEELESRLADFDGVFGIGDSFTRGKVELQLSLKPSARSLGLTLGDLALQVRHALYGAEALRFQRDKDEVKVLVRYPESERRSLADLRRIRIRTRDGREIPFREVAQARLDQGYSTIERTQQRRVIKVYADVNPEKANANELRETLAKEVLPELQGKFPGLFYSMEGEGREQAQSMADMMRGFLVALSLIYALLAVPFKSFGQPLIVMLAIPFGLIGALLGHMLMGLEASMLSLFGMVGLSGVVVNDSLVLVDAANTLRREHGLSPFQAIAEAGPMRFRAIVLTSLTTFGGLTPMILEKSLQAQFLIPMAVSLGFGVLCATGITLLLIPSFYLIREDIDGLFRGSRGRSDEGSEHHPSS